jgi:serine/threonine protein kinase
VRPLKGILLSVISASKLPEHPNLVKHDAPFLTLPENGVGAPSLWVPMEHLPWSLAEEIGQHLRRPMPILEERTIAQMTLDVAQGLTFMHANSIIHRNLSSFAVRVDKKANMEPRTWKICTCLRSEAAAFNALIVAP